MANYVKFSASKFVSDPKKEKVIKVKKTKIAPMGKKRSEENKEYLFLRKEFLLEHTVCPVTGGRATQIHHKKGRIGSLLCDTEYWLAVSAVGHKKIEDNPEWAYKMGYSLKRNERH